MKLSEHIVYMPIVDTIYLFDAVVPCV